jgi:mannitol/fructose-specific phosphotransferase system IIA component (Ntr-type)
VDSLISALLHEGQIQLELRAGDAPEAIRTIAGLLRGNPAVLDPGQLCADVLAREEVGTTVLSRGFALPHARTKAVSNLVLAIGRCRAGVPFGPTAQKAQLIFMIGTPPQMIAQYLELVGQLARRLKDDVLRQCLLDAERAEEFIAVLR